MYAIWFRKAYTVSRPILSDDTDISNVAVLFATNNEYLEERLSWDSCLKDVFMFDRVVGILEKITHIPSEKQFLGDEEQELDRMAWEPVPRLQGERDAQAPKANQVHTCDAPTLSVLNQRPTEKPINKAFKYSPDRVTHVSPSPLCKDKFPGSHSI